MGVKVKNKKVWKLFNAEGCLQSLGKMSLEDYYAMCKSFVCSEDFKKRAIKKLGLDESEISEVEPLFVWGFEWKCKSECKFYYTRNGQLITSQVSGTYIFFSNDRVYQYTMSKDMIEELPTETSNEFTYKDIVSVTITEDTEQRQMRKKKEQYIVTSVAMNVMGDKMRFACINDSETERQVNAMKQKLREKKAE